jgi:hypothetical protein
MHIARATHTATLLADGRVLVAGGCSSNGCGGARVAAQAELYDPARGHFVPGPVMTAPRLGHTATALADGRVLIVGGWPEENRAPQRTAEIFDPPRGAFAAADPMTVRRGGHTATRLRDGRVLVAGGIDGGRALSTVEVYDPATDSWLVAPGRLAAPTYKLAVAAVPGGALVIGGQTADDEAARLASTAVFSLATGRFRPGATMAEPRYKISDAVVRLPDGRLAVAGGFGVEVYASGRFTRAANGRVERQFPAAVELGDGRVLVTGGYDNSTRVTATTLLTDVF